MASDGHRHDVIEGPAAARIFERNLTRVLSVSKDELAQREAEYQQERSTKDRPGPKPGRNYRRKTA